MVGGKKWKWPKRIFFVVFVLLVVFFYGLVPWFLSGIATTSRFHFPDPNDKKDPKSFGVEFHPVEFRASDGILLKGWYLPASGKAKGTIVYAHGHNRTRVEMLPEAVFAHSLGYNGLLFDLRHQGASEGKISSVGYWERLDVEAAVRYAREQEHAAPPAVLWGVSMGAAAALMAAADSPDVSAVISDSTFLNYQDMIRHHYFLFRGFVRARWWWFPPLPGFPIVDEVIYLSGRRGHFEPSDFDLKKAVERIGARPILFIGVEGDPRMPPDIARTLYATSASPAKAITILPGSRHGEGFKLATPAYEQAVKDFLARLPGATETQKEVPHVSRSTGK